MANFRNRKYSEFSPILTDWLREEGGTVEDLTLSLINRAQDELWMYRAWDYLCKYQSLTLSSLTATLPSDFGGRICRIYCDTNSDNKPDRYYHKDGPVDSGYKIVDTFATATGHSVAITFFSTPPSTPVMVYPAILSDFAGTGTEYTYFPADLLIATAQKIHIEEADLVGNEYQAILNRQAQLLRDYEQSHQYQNVELVMRQLDESGLEIENESYDLESGADTRFSEVYDNDYDLG